MPRRRRPKHETRQQRTHRLIEDGACGLLSLDFSTLCPKRGGPEHPHNQHPGKVGFRTCNGCRYNTDLFLDSRVCTHPNARQTAVRSLTVTIQRWEERQAARQQLRLL